VTSVICFECICTSWG